MRGATVTLRTNPELNVTAAIARAAIIIGNSADSGPGETERSVRNSGVARQWSAQAAESEQPMRSRRRRSEVEAMAATLDVRWPAEGSCFNERSQDAGDWPLEPSVGTGTAR